jgi:hypothetical protein
MVEYISGDHIVHKMIVSDPTNKGLEVVKPKLSVKKEEIGVIVRLTSMEGELAQIYSKRSSEDNFTLLAEISNTEYVDKRPNLFGAPELREYKAVFLKQQKMHGVPSDVVLIIKK